jgi:hypothetical protein
MEFKDEWIRPELISPVGFEVACRFALRNIG